MSQWTISGEVKKIKLLNGSKHCAMSLTTGNNEVARLLRFDDVIKESRRT